MPVKFLSADSARRMLAKATGSRLHSLYQLYPYLPFIAFRNSNRLKFFPEAYIAGLAAYLASYSLKADVKSARDFVETPEAKRLAASCVRMLEDWIAAEESYTTSELAEFFGLQPTTIRKWRSEKQLFSGEVRKSRNNQGRSTYVSRQELGASFVWVLPQVLRPAR